MPISSKNPFYKPKDNKPSILENMKISEVFILRVAG